MAKVVNKNEGLNYFKLTSFNQKNQADILKEAD